jgi:hypothetical protein
MTSARWETILSIRRPAATARREDRAHAKAAENALQEWIVSPRVNRSGVGDDDPALIEAA